MKKRIIPLRIDSETIEFVDTLVNLGFYTDRSKALREIIRLGKETLHKKTLLNLTNLIDRVIELEKKTGEQLITIPGLRQIIISERDRWQ